ncbi:low molecular weight phosphatase family protein [Empedobacter sp. UBA1574]|uniref:arsenate-mycothiol transferase ArsC n=1 Tax=Empedobacter sp. UBA1574 TaxID=1946429 RepID=UPI0025C38B7D|nr:protein-tyrosine-phosphatase [Empedobacter sp. UBA1574]
MNSTLKTTVSEILNFNFIDDQRKANLQPLVVYIQEKFNRKEAINLNFICTHNSRRSHLAQIWAQFAAAYYNIQNINCYSGGTQETALFPKVIETLSNQGFQIFKITDSNNPIYAIKYDENSSPIIGFSKKYNDAFNPISNFAAILTCSQADEGCPFISGAEKRIPITYEDPKISDDTTEQTEVYKQRSFQIATEMMYIFSQITK